MIYSISKLIIPPIYRMWIRKVEGMENIPKDKVFIVAANHTSYFDVLLLPSIILPKISIKMHALVNSYYWSNKITGFFLTKWECIPVYVENEKNSKQKNKEALQKALKYLKNNEIMMVFPEGKRSSDGKLQKAYNGIAILALKARVPVLPCGIKDSNKVMPKGKIFPRFARCEVKIGKPIYFEKYYNKISTKKTLNGVTISIMKEIAKLINQEYNY